MQKKKETQFSCIHFLTDKRPFQPCKTHPNHSSYETKCFLKSSSINCKPPSLKAFRSPNFHLPLLLICFISFPQTLCNFQINGFQIFPSFSRHKMTRNKRTFILVITEWSCQYTMFEHINEEPLAHLYCLDQQKGWNPLYGCHLSCTMCVTVHAGVESLCHSG